MKRSRGSYAAGGTPAVVKEYRAQLAAALKRQGVSLDFFLIANNETDFVRPAKLTDEHWDVVAGAILMEKN